MLTPLERNSILSISAITGDSRGHGAYVKLLRTSWQVEAKFDQYLPRGQYGTALDIVLFQFFVEGTHHWFTMPEKIKSGRYSAKGESFSIKIPMHRKISDAVLENDIVTANGFLTETFGKGLELINASKTLAKVDFDINRFNLNYLEFMKHLLDDAPK